MAKPTVYPGINPRAQVNNLPTEEQTIAHVLSRDFYITGGFNEVSIGTSKYRYFFLRFPDDKAITYGVRDEIIVLLSPFENFEPRTLDAIEKIQEENSGFRLDKISAFVISKDSDFIEKLNKTIKTQKECRIITPFTYSELQSPKNTDFYRQRIKQFFFERNLFDFDSPLRRDLYFFGRDELCQNLIDKHQTGQSASLFGLRRSGKTSILLSVCRRITNQNGFASIIDCQLLYQLPWYAALYHVAFTINSDHHAKVVINEAEYTDEKATITFARDIEKIHKKLRKSVLLAFDEIEQITFGVSFGEAWRNGSSYVRFWHSLRSLAQRQENPVTLLLAGTNPRCLETPFVMGGDNPLYGHVKPEYIPGFSLPQAKQMIETLSSYMGISIDDDIYAYLVREFGGHPFLMRQACSYIKSELDKGMQRHIDRLMYEKSIAQFNEGLGHGFCELVIGVLAEHYIDEYTMLTYLARGDISEFEQLAESDSTYTQHLLGYGVISKSPSGYDFKIDSIKKHLSLKERYKKLNLTDAEKLAEIGERRNEIEHRLRRLVSQVLRSIHGEDEAKRLVLAKHDAKTRSKYSALTYRELFDANKHEIYFNDLKELMRKNWEGGFRNIFSEDVEKFNSRMVLLNSIGRSDAHKKDVSDADMQSFRGAMSWLEAKVDEYFA
ncbi:MAG: hypothetical protein CMN89_12265 [Sutterellaceae bacterium]|uniref:hypothetical protein n=1 Tax=unclassified Limnobacter TaxID=2630203 RepID=UPI000C5D7064|nr:MULTISPECIES: hypothetical protein [unclassified Limnobacter]MAG79741.1 hypothetical protein [Sutterellaceae bacterium]MBT85227.1 hypothetical protein [Sutterellaceae bacterium]|tara:strand:- start:3506 stop:5500 length:1995 start_codon:yes stop_codon:yes gene_type:complete